MTCARSRIQQTADLVTEMAAVVPRRVIAELMGVTPEHLTRFYELAARFMDRTLTVAERDATAIAMRQNMDALVEHKRKHPGDDILSHEIDRQLAEPAPFPASRLRIRRGDGVSPSSIAANGDPAVFDRSDELVLDRRPNPHLAQGELTVVYETRFRALPTLRPGQDDDALPFELNGLIFGLASLPVTW